MKRLSWEGPAMIRISLKFFYELGATANSLAPIKAGEKLIDWWSPMYRIQNDLTGLLNQAGWFAPAIRTSYNAGTALVRVLEEQTKKTDFAAELTQVEAYNIVQALGEFETILKSEFAIADVYFVTRKAAYDTSVLISNAEYIFSPELGSKVPEVIQDVREGGKCLAFELGTAAGFHVLRAVEGVLKRYWAVVSGGKKPPYTKTIGAYLKRMEDEDVGNKKVRAALAQIKDLHRNPLMHPRDTLSMDEAVSLFGVCQSAISGMLKEIPFPAAPPPTVSTTPP